MSEMKAEIALSSLLFGVLLEVGLVGGADVDLNAGCF